MCKGEKLGTIGQGGYADLGETGKWLRSVQCAFYDMSLSPAEISRMRSTFFVKRYVEYACAFDVRMVQLMMNDRISSSRLEGMSSLEI